MIVTPGVVYIESLDIFKTGQYSLAVAHGVLPEVTCSLSLEGGSQARDQLAINSSFHPSGRVFASEKMWG